MAFLYIDSKGNERNRHSYSAGLEFDQCPYKYWLRRVQGWREKTISAARLFGIALEDAIQFHHATKFRPGVAEEEFVRLWAEHKDKELVYTKREIDWHSLLRAGREMIRLYVIKQPSLPIPMDTLFQRQFTKPVFGNDPRFAGIEFYAKLDMIARVQPDHPLLPKIEWSPKDGLFRKLIIDMKTSGNKLNDTTGIVAHDLQLRQYAWLLETYDVAFLWFQKSGHSIKKGSNVTLLIDTLRFPAGTEVVVASVEPNGAYIVGNDEMLEEMNKAQGYREGTHDLDTKKEAKERAARWREENAILVKTEDITKQRVQFSAARVNPASALDAGRIAADQIVRIVNAWESNKWTNTFGVRYPHDDSRDPYFRAFLLDDKTFRDATFEQKHIEDLSDYFDEPEEAQ